MPLYRHGDLLVSQIDELPDSVRKLRHLVLAKGELTGHAHRIAEKDSAILFQSTTSEDCFLEVTSETVTLVHDEHGPISLPRGIYRFWRQREYSPQEIRIVRD